ncbi:MAG: OsmC family protein [Nitriliruptoraceae bacterium]
MTARTSSARWEGDLKGGTGSMALGSGAFEGPFTFVSRFEEGPGTNPEELLAAAHAGCFSMSVANLLAQEGTPATSIDTEATVHLERVDGKPTITRVVLATVGEVPGIDEATFVEKAELAKGACPVSKLFASAEIELEVTFRG